MIAEVARLYHHFSRLDHWFSHMMHWTRCSPPKAKYRLLYVGNDLGLAEFAQEALKREGWFVVRCPGGSGARVLLSSEIHYDLLMFDEELQGWGGMELAVLARSVEHRKRTPVILLSRRGVAAEALCAGAGVFLQQPEPFHAVVEAVRHLLVSSGGK